MSPFPLLSSLQLQCLLWWVQVRRLDSSHLPAAKQFILTNAHQQNFSDLICKNQGTSRVNDPLPYEQSNDKNSALLNLRPDYFLSVWTSAIHMVHAIFALFEDMLTSPISWQFSQILHILHKRLLLKTRSTRLFHTNLTVVSCSPTEHVGKAQSGLSHVAWPFRQRQDVHVLLSSMIFAFGYKYDKNACTLKRSQNLVQFRDSGRHWSTSSFSHASSQASFQLNFRIKLLISLARKPEKACANL